MRYRMLTRNNEFARTYARGASFVHPLLVLYVNKNRSGRLRIGLTATKKVGNAVQRNRARRVMRAALDAVLPSELVTARGKGLDLVLVARGATHRKKSQEIAAVLAKLCTQAGVQCRAQTASTAAPHNGQAVPCAQQTQAAPSRQQVPFGCTTDAAQAHTPPSDTLNNAQAQPMACTPQP